MEYFDDALNGADYLYYVAAVRVESDGSETESAASAVHRATDAYDATSPVRNLIATDGRESFPTLNARSRQVRREGLRMPRLTRASSPMGRRSVTR